MVLLCEPDILYLVSKDKKMNYVYRYNYNSCHGSIDIFTIPDLRLSFFRKRMLIFYTCF